MGILGLTPASGEPELAAQLAQAQSELVRVEQRASTAIANARAAVTAAQGAVDTFRLGQVQDAAGKWRERAQELRQEASEAGNATVVVSRTVMGGMGPERLPELVFLSEQLEAEAREADAYAGVLEAWVQAGYAGPDLEPRYAELRWPEAETVAA